MASGKKGVNTGDSSPAVTTKYNLRNRKVEGNIDADDASDNSSSSSKRGLSKNDRPADVFSTIPSSEGSAKKQSSHYRQFSDPTDDGVNFPSKRPPIRSHDGGRKETQHRQYEMDDQHEINYNKYRYETRSEHTKTQTSQSSSEAFRLPDEEGRFQQSKGQLNETAGKRETWSKNHAEESVLYHRSQKPKDRVEESVLYHRSQKPKEKTKIQPVQSGEHFSDGGDDDYGEDKEVPFLDQQKKAFAPRPVGRQDINHYTEKRDEQKVRKPPTKSFIQSVGTCGKYLVLTFVVLLVGSAALPHILLAVHNIADQMKFVDEPQVKIDLKDDFEKLSSTFTNQSPLMWDRSRRILERHLKNWKENTEPAIILLTGALDAEQALLCVGTQLADIYSSSLSGNYTVISGSDWTSKSNEEAKESIDEKLSAGFQATSRAGLLHRIELLPAGSLLILYKYCDHESAMFKNVALLLTVLLDDETLDKDIPFIDLEEKVRAYLIEKLNVSNTKASHDAMDKDKFSGVWSRISHVVLPVFPEKNMGHCAKEPN